MDDAGRWSLLLEVAAAIAAGWGRPRDAVVMAAAAASRRAKLGGGPPNFLANIYQMIADAKAALAEHGGSAAVEDAWAEGGGLDDDALTEIIGRAAASVVPVD
jgi:hypothetical protein